MSLTNGIVGRQHADLIGSAQIMTVGGMAKCSAAMLTGGPGNSLRHEVATAEGDAVSDPTNYAITYAREFRYDGARQRYLVRELDTDDLLCDWPVATAISDVWSDYGGDNIYGDFTVDGQGNVTMERSYEPGIARSSVPLDPVGTEYYHSDMIGTTRLMTDSDAGDMYGVAYTAFGERITSENHRYGYAGTWGYQAATSDTPGDPYAAFPYLHVGHRYYDPATGRFLQRDPIGIRGGLNVYAYVRNGPTIRIDPDGLFDVAACVGYCQTRDKTCRGGAKTVKGAGKCVAKYKECETCCGNADIDSEMGNDRGPPPYGPPPATFDPYPSGGPHWRAIAILLLCFVSLWVKRVQPVPRVSK